MRRGCYRMLKFQGIHRRQSLLKAVETLRLMNQDEQVVVPKNAPREFVPRRWRPYVFDDEKIDRTYYELCVLSELSLALRSGDIWVPGSRRYLPFDEYLLPPQAWKSLQASQKFLTCDQYREQRRPQLHEGLEQITRLLSEGQLPGVALEKGRLTITPLKADVPEQVEEWSDRVYDLLPRPAHGGRFLDPFQPVLHPPIHTTAGCRPQPGVRRDSLGCHQHWPQEDRRRHAWPDLCQTELGRRLVCSRRELR